ncbi:cache domain-containing sensor histidine kinase [Hydrogenispora ethanolica]|nr:sensor histidine kinase [Hydrogenispora ethanolica]
MAETDWGTTMWDWLGNLKLKHKIALLCMALIVVSTLISAVLLYRYVAAEIRQNAYVSSADLLTQVSNFLDEKLKGIIRRVYALELNQDFHKTLANLLFNEEKYRYALALSRFANSFSEIRSTETFTSSIFMDTPKGEFFDLSKIKNPSFHFKSSRLSRELRFEPGQAVYWGKSRRDEIYRDAKPVIPMVFQFAIDGYNGDLHIVVNLDREVILEYLGQIYSGAGNWIAILDERGHEVVSGRDRTTRWLLQDRAALRQIAAGQQGRFRRRYQGANYSISYQGMAVAPWKIVNIQSEKVLLKKVNAFGAFLFILTAASIAGGLVLTLFLSRSITQPLAALESAIQKVTRRDFDVTFVYRYRDEVGQLGQSFNFMVGEIKGLIQKLNEYIARLREEKEKVRSEQVLKRRAELKALQAQINPHFLYNTLESIRWMADKSGADDISRMTIALSTLFRTGLNKGREFITIGDELENVASYLTIQKMRYGDQFDFTIDLPEGLQRLMTVKLILQPIVENAIYHGIKEKDGAGVIRICVRRVAGSADLELLIEDDGRGIHPAKLELINQRLAGGMPAAALSSEGEGYGIYNVNERIRLYFGDRYGLKFASKWERGTVVRILIPALNQEEIAKYVQVAGG